MFELFHSRRLPTGRLPRRSVTLGFDRLETRDCPSTVATIASFAATPLNNGHQVRIQGTVQDENPATVSITLGGVVSGTFYPNANGSFSYDTNASGLGNVTAVAHDQMPPFTSSASAAITSNAPSITLTVTKGARRSVTLSGTVTDEAPGGLTVTFTGKVTGTTQTNANGTFSFTTNATGAGQVSGTVTDPWGLTSNPGTGTIGNAAPVIVDFMAIEEGDNIWTLSGSVIDEDPEGLVVRFGGLPSFAGTSAVVEADGTFSITIRLQPGEHGTVTADTTDWYGLDAEEVFAIIN